MMLRNDTWRGRDAHQGLTEGFGPWRVGWSGPGRIARGRRSLRSPQPERGRGRIEDLAEPQNE